ncbi:MAG: glycosyltransferase [Marinilabiliaceae bacterium]|nr:glycosyltransferase [Marinilabiliaceae bacterium]
MNILFVCSAKSWGGNEKWTSMAMKALSSEHRIFFIGRNEQLIERFGKYTDHLCLPFSSYFDVVTYFKLKQFIQKHNINLVLSTKKREYFLCGLLSKHMGFKHLMRLGVTRKMNIPLWHKLNYHQLNDGLIVNAQQIKTQLLKHPFFEPQKIHVIYNGLPGFDESSELPVKNENDSIFRIVSSGRLTVQKGFHLLIEAISLLPEAYRQQVQLKIIGDGRNKEEFEQQVINLNLSHNVSFTGFVNHTTDELQGADLFVLLSQREGISNGVLEAMTQGIAVMTTNAGGISEIVTDHENGFIVNRSAEEVKNKIQFLMDHRKLVTSAGAKGFATVKEKFGFTRFTKDTLKLINLFSPSK